MAIPVYIPTNNAVGFPFLHILLLLFGKDLSSSILGIDFSVRKVIGKILTENVVA